MPATNPKRFVFLTLGYTPDLDGGGYRYATEVAETLAQRGHEVHALYPNPKNAFPSRETRNGVQLHRVPKAPGGFFAGFKTANRDCRTEIRQLLEASPKPTLLFLHQAYLAPALNRLPYAMILQGPWGLEHRFARQAGSRSWLHRRLDDLAVTVMTRIERRALINTQLLFVASEYSKSRIPHWHAGLKLSAEVIGGGADLTRFHPVSDRAALRSARGLSDSDFLFLAVRRLDPRMGLMQLVEGFAEVARRHPRARLWIAGKGNQHAALEKRIRSLGLESRARLCGFVPEDELPRLYAIADCTLMPSLDLEGFGLATAESLACGTPVVASRAGANPELIAPLGDELLFEPGDPRSLASRLDRILSGTLSLPDRESCVAYAGKEFRWGRPADALERAFDRVARSGWPEGVP
jgi:glycosyltransferase involved in cell wall biosynthesis